MARRITRAFVQARIDIVNRLLGYDVPKGGIVWSNQSPPIGAVYLSGAYGGWAVYQWVNEHAGATDLSGHGHATLHEASTFLAGVIEGLRMADANRILKGEA
jgi:hypothetical protein